MTEEPEYGLDDLSAVDRDPGPPDEYDPRFTDGRALTELRQETTTSSAGGSQNGHIDPIRIVTLREFVTTTDDIQTPLIGTPDSALLPADGTLLMYGDGGAGKTTLSVDALAHLAAGQPWLGLNIPTALKVMLIENEGPRGPFRRRLAQKVEQWSSDPFEENVVVMEEPWTRFTLREADYRHQLGLEIARFEIDLVIVGPLASLGAKGTGTPDEVSEFDLLVRDLRLNAARPFGLWIVHHENKAGDVSGAWERLPDALVHISAQGNGKTRVHWRKARWSSELHNTSVTLQWAENSGFTVEEKKEHDYPKEILEAFENDDRWRTAKEISGLIAGNEDRVRAALGTMVQSGEMSFEIGPSGRHVTARCYRLASGDLRLSDHLGSPTHHGGDEEEVIRVIRPLRGSPRDHLHPPGPTPDPDTPGSPDDGIPF